MKTAKLLFKTFTLVGLFMWTCFAVTGHLEATRAGALPWVFCGAWLMCLLAAIYALFEYLSRWNKRRIYAKARMEPGPRVRG